MPQAKRPSIVTVIAVLNLLLGLLGMTGAILNAVALTNLMAPPPAAASEASSDMSEVKGKGRGVAEVGMAVPLEPINVEAQKPKHPADPNDLAAVSKEKQKFLLRVIPSYDVYLTGILVLYGILAFILLASGIGLLKLRPVGRQLVFVFFVCAAAATVITSNYSYQTVLPELISWENGRNDLLVRAFQETPPPPQVRVEVLGIIAILAACGVVYPFLQVIVMLLPSVRAAFRVSGQPAAPVTAAGAP